MFKTHLTHSLTAVTETKVHNFTRDKCLLKVYWSQKVKLYTLFILIYYIRQSYLNDSKKTFKNQKPLMFCGGIRNGVTLCVSIAATIYSHFNYSYKANKAIIKICGLTIIPIQIHLK